MTGAEFRATRKQLNKTQKQFAEILGIHPITAANYERGEYKIPRTVELAVQAIVTLESEAPTPV
jgi:transcriptional regulator with XRE-family HTH domain